jgi:hypothetical protein
MNKFFTMEDQMKKLSLMLLISLCYIPLISAMWGNYSYGLPRMPRNPRGPQVIQTAPPQPPLVGRSPVLTKVDGSTWMIFKKIQPTLDVPSNDNDVASTLESNGFVLVPLNQPVAEQPEPLEPETIVHHHVPRY